MPLLGGSAASSCSNASRPPAEAPTPTTEVGWEVGFGLLSLAAPASTCRSSADCLSLICGRRFFGGCLLLFFAKACLSVLIWTIRRKRHKKDTRDTKDQFRYPLILAMAWA